MSEHRWAIVAVTRLTDERAAQIAGLEYLDRLAMLDEMRHDATTLTGQPAALRGPVCTECRVDWATVHRDEHNPWPCPGKRPGPLGGSLNEHLQSPKLSRPQRRRQRREAVTEVERQRRSQIRLAVSGGIAKAKTEAKETAD